MHLSQQKLFAKNQEDKMLLKHTLHYFSTKNLIFLHLDPKLSTYFMKMRKIIYFSRNLRWTFMN